MIKYKNYVALFIYPDGSRTEGEYDFFEEADKHFKKNYALTMVLFKATHNNKRLKKMDRYEKDRDELIQLLMEDNKALRKEKAGLLEKIKGLEEGEPIVKQDNNKNVELTAIIGLYRSGGMSFQTIADKLNTEGRTNSRGNAFNKMTVQRLFKKYEAEQQDLLRKK